ncbi:hypothetical protein [Tautonia plasticadhaerens]|uniref:Uncharacterized protein n=1 Tax=Tautonia plasticadhaerens TaxID=2527974 RepID=A0A518H2T3_9BACT|nr:hypothetical protein [Tautonia plasticadhaerens]QDV35137.1 hypothetical protein ElP_30400 [Tautonia plasticadhaerens]
MSIDRRSATGAPGPVLPASPRRRGDRPGAGEAIVTGRLAIRAAAAVLCLAAIAGCGRAPAMGPDEDAFTTIDALYTAVSLQDPGQLERNAATLDQLNQADRLPDAAHDALTGMIAEARGGDWESARQALRDFMLDQRPEH